MSGATYTQDAKAHQENKAYSNAIIAFCKQIKKKPIDTTEEDLRDNGVLPSMMSKSLKGLAIKYAEYYGVAHWELAHDPEQTQIRAKIKDKHLDFMLKHLNTNKVMSYFRKIQVDGGGGFNIPTEIVSPVADEYLVNNLLNEFKEADKRADLATKKD